MANLIVRSDNVINEFVCRSEAILGDLSIWSIVLWRRGKMTDRYALVSMTKSTVGHFAQTYPEIIH